MNIVRVKKHIEYFVVLSKEAMNDPLLSWKAKGLHCYLMSLPGDWKINMADLENRSSDGRMSVRSAVDELLTLGYAKRTVSQTTGGKISGYDWVIFEHPAMNADFQPDRLTTLPPDGKPTATKEPENTKEQSDEKPTKKINIGVYFYLWKKLRGGVLMLGKDGKEAFSQLEEMYGHDAVVASWDTFCRSPDSKFGWKVFAQRYKDYGRVHVEVEKPDDIHSD